MCAVGIHKNEPAEMILIKYHNVCFYGELKKIIL